MTKPDLTCAPEELMDFLPEGWSMVLKNCDGMGGLGIKYLGGTDPLIENTIQAHALRKAALRRQMLLGQIRGFHRIGERLFARYLDGLTHLTADDLRIVRQFRNLLDWAAKVPAARD